MTRGRTPVATQPATLPAVNEGAVEVSLQAADRMEALQRVQGSALEVGRLTGRIESMLFLRTCADRVIAETFIQLREGKKYKDLVLDDGSGNLRPCADLPEVCERLLGKSYRACAELAQNYEALGSDLYDKAEQIGLRRNDYRAIRALPTDDQTLVQHAIESSSDRDSVAELISEIVARNERKLAAKDQEIEAARRAREQRDSTINQQQATIDQLNRELAGKPQTGPEDEAVLREQWALDALASCAMKTVAAIDVGLRKQINLLEAQFGEEPPPNHVRLAQQQALTQVIQAARVLAADFGIDLPLSTQTPQELAWLANMQELAALDDAAVPQAINEGAGAGVEVLDAEESAHGQQ